MRSQERFRGFATKAGDIGLRDRGGGLGERKKENLYSLNEKSISTTVGRVGEFIHISLVWETPSRKRYGELGDRW